MDSSPWSHKSQTQLSNYTTTNNPIISQGGLYLISVKWWKSLILMFQFHGIIRGLKLSGVETGNL